MVLWGGRGDPPRLGLPSLFGKPRSDDAEVLRACGGRGGAQWVSPRAPPALLSLIHPRGWCSLVARGLLPGLLSCVCSAEGQELWELHTSSAPGPRSSTKDQGRRAGALAPLPEEPHTAAASSRSR